MSAALALLRSPGRSRLGTGWLSGVSGHIRATPRSAHRWSSHLSLTPVPETQQKWFDTLRTSPRSIRSVTIDTHPDPYYTSNRTEDWGVEGGPTEAELTPDYFRALSSLSSFPNIIDITLRFTSDCVGVGNDSIFSDYFLLEPHDRRLSLLQSFFHSTAQLCRTQRHLPNHTPRLSTLTIRNLQNTPEEHVTLSPDFLETTQDLTALHLQICTEWSPDHFLTLPDMVRFWPHLRARWLEPLAPRLEALTLYCDAQWGLWPQMDLRGLRFPRLRSLALGTYVFGLDEQVDWLLGHKTLEQLALDSCGICVGWEFGPYDDPAETAELGFAMERLAVRTDPEGVRGERGDQWSFGYGARWPGYFGRIERELPALRRFQFGGAWDPWGDVGPFFL